MKLKAEGVRKIWDRYKCAALVALIGAGLLLWPGGKSVPGGAISAGPEKAEQPELQAQLEDILATISGVGQVRVLLTVESGGERQLAQDTELEYSGPTASPEDYSRRSETVLVKGGNGAETVTVRQTYPTYRGALVVCQGGDRAEVRLAVTEAVAALTGLTSDRVTVAKWQ
mgnify:FL=1